MRLSKNPGTTRVMMNITPLIDIVFLLIIFFVTVSQITEVNREKHELPKLEGDNDQTPTSIVINVAKDGIIKISGKERSLPETVAMVGNELAKKGNEPSLIKVLIRIDRRADNGVYNQLARQLKTMGITQVKFGVQVE